MRYGDIEGEFTVDVREDIVTLDDDPVTEEYIEGFIYNTYDEAKKKYVEFLRSIIWVITGKDIKPLVPNFLKYHFES